MGVDINFMVMRGVKVEGALLDEHKGHLLEKECYESDFTIVYDSYSGKYAYIGKIFASFDKCDEEGELDLAELARFDGEELRSKVIENLPYLKDLEFKDMAFIHYS